MKQRYFLTMGVLLTLLGISFINLMAFASQINNIFLLVNSIWLAIVSLTIGTIMIMENL